MSAEKITVEVAYALPDIQRIIQLQVRAGTTALEAVKASGIVEQFPEINPEEARMGIFGKAIAQPAKTVLARGDRVEIYRPLLIDPKQARLARAKKKARDA